METPCPALVLNISSRERVSILAAQTENEISEWMVSLSRGSFSTGLLGISGNYIEHLKNHICFQWRQIFKQYRHGQMSHIYLKLTLTTQQKLFCCIKYYLEFVYCV